jgi:hypothetical protein
VSCRVGESPSAGWRPSASSRLGLTFRGSALRSLKTYLASAHSPYALDCFQAAPSGLCFATSTSDLNPPPLLSACCPSPRSFTTTLQPQPLAQATAPFVRFRPLQRSTVPGVRMPRWIHPPAPFGFSVSHALAALLRPKPCRAYFIPAALMGFSRTLPTRAEVSLRQGRHAHVSSSRLSPLPRRARFGVLSRLALRRAVRRDLSDLAAGSCRRALHGLDHRRIGFPKVASQGYQPS